MELNDEGDIKASINRVYASFNRVKAQVAGRPDREVRHPEWTRTLLDMMDQPDVAAYNVAVTGSKGKGSHAVLLAGIMERLGLRVGLFTGPHLVHFTERFRVNGTCISQEGFVRLMDKLSQQMQSLPIPDGQYIGPVGILSVIAALWFREEHTDVNVFELGRGARHDDVNQVTHQGAVVAPIFLEHARELGPSLAEVVWEKAGVVTSDTRWVSAQAQTPEVAVALEEQAEGTGASVHFVGRDISFTVLQTDDRGTVDVDVWSERLHTTVSLPTSSPYVYANAACAVAAAERAWTEIRRGRPFPDRVDLRDIRLPGRLQVVRRHPLTVVDGAIHGRSARYVARWVQDERDRGVVDGVGAIVAVPADKDGVGVLTALRDVVDWFVLTPAQNPHLRFTEDLLAWGQSAGMDIQTAPTLDAALSLTEVRVGATDALLIVGTQSIVGEALQWFGLDPRNMWNS